MKTPLSLSKVTNGQEYDIVFLAGGHGCMFDFPKNKTLSTLLGAAWDANRVLASVCHGACGLLHVMDGRTGQPVLAGKRCAAFSNEEEKLVGKNKLVPFALEPALVKAGAQYSKGEAWKPHAVRDDHLVTGQNPASSRAVAEEAMRAAAEAVGQPSTPH